MPQANLPEVAAGGFWAYGMFGITGVMVFIINLFVEWIADQVGGVVDAMFNFPEIGIEWGVALSWFELSNSWVPISEAVILAAAFFVWDLVVVPSAKFVKYCIPTVG